MFNNRDFFQEAILMRNKNEDKEIETLTRFTVSCLMEFLKGYKGELIVKIDDIDPYRIKTIFSHYGSMIAYINDEPFVFSSTKEGVIQVMDPKGNVIVANYTKRTMYSDEQSVTVSALIYDNNYETNGVCAMDISIPFVFEKENIHLLKNGLKKFVYFNPQSLISGNYDVQNLDGPMYAKELEENMKKHSIYSDEEEKSKIVKVGTNAQDDTLEILSNLYNEGINAQNFVQMNSNQVLKKKV